MRFKLNCAKQFGLPVCDLYGQFVCLALPFSALFKHAHLKAVDSDWLGVLSTHQNVILTPSTQWIFF